MSRGIAIARVLAMAGLSLSCGSPGGSGSGETGETGAGTASAESGGGNGSATVGADETGAPGGRTISLLSLDGNRGCVALDQPDEVLCWPTIAGAPVPVAMPVAGLPAPVQKLSGGDNHTCALTEGAVWCWGQNDELQLGHEGESTEVPQIVVGLPSPVTDVSAAQLRTCAVAAGDVWCWGNRYPFHPSSATPTRVEGLPPDVVAVATGAIHQCALVDDTVYCWGTNSNGQLGDGTTDQREAPAPVVGLPGGVSQIDAGSVHTCVLADGVVFCWGGNDRLQVEEDAGAISVTLPFERGDLPGSASIIAVNAEGSCALADGHTMCWGEGAPSGIDLKEVPEAAGATLLAIGITGGCALVDELTCWGGAMVPPAFEPDTGESTGADSGGGTDDPYGPCTDAAQCPIEGSNCPASTGACQPPGDVSACPEAPGFTTVCEAGRCSIPCDLDTPCPPDMVCLAAIVCGWP